MYIPEGNPNAKLSHNKQVHIGAWPVPFIQPMNMVIRETAKMIHSTINKVTMAALKIDRKSFFTFCFLIFFKAAFSLSLCSLRAFSS